MGLALEYASLSDVGNDRWLIFLVAAGGAKSCHQTVRELPLTVESSASESDRSRIRPPAVSISVICGGRHNNEFMPTMRYKAPTSPQGIT